MIKAYTATQSNFIPLEISPAKNSTQRKRKFNDINAPDSPNFEL